MRVLVTGGSGFLGHAIVTALQQAHPGWTLFNLDVKPPAQPQEQVSYLHADITVASSVETALLSSRPDAVIHTAGHIPAGNDRYSKKASVLARARLVNHAGTLNVLRAARLAGCRALVYTSSCTVITDDVARDYPNMREDALALGSATLPYGASKAPAEAAVLAANDDDGDDDGTSAFLRTCALRPSTVFGPGDALLLPALHACIAKRETPFVLGAAHNLYDFVYVSNAADAHVLALENLCSADPTAAGQALFVSNHQPVYFRDFMLAVWAQFGHVPPFVWTVPLWLAWWLGAVAEVLAWVTGSEATLSRGSVGDAVGTRYASPEKATRVLGYRPRVDMVEGVRLACEDWKRVLAERARGEAP